jgi:hypothetical protein
MSEPTRKEIPMKTIVVVQRLNDFGDDFADTLTNAGYQVRMCGGPHAPGYVCLGQTMKDCPLWAESDLMIYDPWVQTNPRQFGSGTILKLEHARHPDRPVLIWGSGGAIPRDVADLEKDGELEILPLEMTSAELLGRRTHDWSGVAKTSGRGRFPGIMKSTRPRRTRIRPAS